MAGPSSADDNSPIAFLKTCSGVAWRGSALAGMIDFISTVSWASAAATFRLSACEA